MLRHCQVEAAVDVEGRQVHGPGGLQGGPQSEGCVAPSVDCYAPPFVASNCQALLTLNFEVSQSSGVAVGADVLIVFEGAAVEDVDGNKSILMGHG